MAISSINHPLSLSQDLSCTICTHINERLHKSLCNVFFVCSYLSFRKCVSSFTDKSLKEVYFQNLLQFKLVWWGLFLISGSMLLYLPSSVGLSVCRRNVNNFRNVLGALYVYSHTCYFYFYRQSPKYMLWVADPNYIDWAPTLQKWTQIMQWKLY